jgi:hypothetical protein
MSAAWLSVIPVIANSSIPASDSAALIQCQAWSCRVQNCRALRCRRAGTAGDKAAAPLPVSDNEDGLATLAQLL